MKDTDEFSQFNFLTNWGEMFDNRGKSFILKQPDGKLRIINFDYEANLVNTYICTELAFRHAVKGFSNWYESQLKQMEA